MLPTQVIICIAFLVVSFLQSLSKSPKKYWTSNQVHSKSTSDPMLAAWKMEEPIYFQPRPHFLGNFLLHSTSIISDRCWIGGRQGVTRTPDHCPIMLQYQTKEAITHSLINGNRLYTDSDSFSIIPWGEVERYIRDFSICPQPPYTVLLNMKKCAIWVSHTDVKKAKNNVLLI